MAATNKDATKAEANRKVKKGRHEFKEGDLKSSGGETVTNRMQAIAIAIQRL